MARKTPAVMRTLDILELFLEGAVALSMADIVEKTELPRSSVHELITTLRSRGYLQKDESTGRYRLGVTLLHLGNAYAERFDLLGAANIAARLLSEQLDETVSVAIRQGSSVFYLAKVEPHTLLQLPSNIGQRMPASCTGLGKALLAAESNETVSALYPDMDQLPVLTDRSISTLPALLEELQATRARGYALEHGESTPGLHCAASVVMDAQGNASAAISTAVSETRWNLRPEKEWADAVRGAAAEFSAQLGYRKSVAPNP